MVYRSTHPQLDHLPLDLHTSSSKIKHIAIRIVCNLVIYLLAVVIVVGPILFPAHYDLWLPAALVLAILASIVLTLLLRQIPAASGSEAEPKHRSSRLSLTGHSGKHAT